MVWIDLLICYLFGIFGGHKFREKKVALGLLYLFTFGLFGFGWLFDCIRYLIIAIKSLNPTKNKSVYSDNNQFVSISSTDTSQQTSKSHPLRTALLILLGCIVFVLLLSALFGDTSISSNIDDGNLQLSSTISSSTNTEHTHIFSPATCLDPEKCSCGAINSEALGHKWTAATCVEPKTCSVCEVTEGNAAGHSWKSATCTSPKTCIVCKLTEGNAADHTWKNATCTSPKTCSTCGATEGNAKNHNYASGKCTACGSKDPNYTSETMVWIPTNGGEKYHSKSTCSKMQDPEHVTKSEAISRGFTPCGRCYG